MRLGVLRAFAAAAIALAAPGYAGAAETKPALTTIAVSPGNGGARVTLDVTGDVAATARPVAGPDRILIDLPEMGFSPQAGAESARADGLVSDVRFGDLNPGQSRIVVELQQKLCVGTFTQGKSQAGTRLSLQLTPCEASEFAAAAEAAPVASRPEKPAALPVVVIDPGHGGADSGARGVKGVIEKTVVFDFASELKRQLDATGRYKTLMTRAGDQYVALEDRVKFSEDAGASLMISIHADSFPVRSHAEADDIFGTTVYTCSEKASDKEAARTAARENASDREGMKSGDDNGVADILNDLKRRETRAYAHIFSRGLVAQLGEAGRLNRRPQRAAGFFVLKAPDYPSVLVELGYLSNTEDVAHMTDAKWRQKAVAAMAAAVDGFFAPKPAGAESGEAVAKTNH